MPLPVRRLPDGRGDGYAPPARRSPFLPFLEQGVSVEQTYFGDGIVEDIIGALASLQDVFVISGNSTLKYRGRSADLPLIGNELGVRYILSGRIHRSAIRISAELADAQTLGVLWTDQVSGDVAELFTVQDRLTERVIQTIAPNIYGAEIRRVVRTRTENFDAYDYMLRGLDLIYRLTPEKFNQAQVMFQKSIELDDSYATPYALAALRHSIRANQGWSPDERDDFAAVDRFAAAALERDQLNVWALALSGHLRAFLFRDFEGAVVLFDRAVSVSPNSAFTWARSSSTFCYIGEGAEAQRRAGEAIRLSPFDPQIFFTHTALGHAAYVQGNYENAAVWGRQAFVENPKYTANLRLFVASLAAVRRAGGGAPDRTSVNQIGAGLPRSEILGKLRLSGSAAPDIARSTPVTGGASRIGAPSGWVRRSRRDKFRPNTSAAGAR